MNIAAYWARSFVAAAMEAYIMILVCGHLWISCLLRYVRLVCFVCRLST